MTTKRRNRARIIARFDRQEAFVAAVSRLDDDGHAAVMDDAEAALKRERRLRLDGQIECVVGAPARGSK